MVRGAGAGSTRDTPFNFVRSNDIIGGNSGSPMINRDGEIVGLVFDGNIQCSRSATRSTTSESTARSPSHSSRILEALRKIYGAGALADEIAAR